MILPSVVKFRGRGQLILPIPIVLHRYCVFCAGIRVPPLTTVERISGQNELKSYHASMQTSIHYTNGVHFCYTAPMKSLLKKLLPESLLSFYHRAMAHFGAWRYGHPSKKMIVIGVTGTKGKSTTGNILWRLLTEAGYTVGLTGTVNYRIGDHEELTTNKMTMSGRMQLQHWLKRMVDAKCDIAIVETTSEGIKQWRHLGVHYDVVMITNLTPEHLESHGGFENYKQAKLELFRHLDRLKPKTITGREIPQVGVVNMDNEHGPSFAATGEYRKILVGESANNDIVLGAVRESLKGTDFAFNGLKAHVPLLGAWNAHNALMAIGAAHAVGVPLEKLATAAGTVEPVPGRMEFVDEGQPFSVIVDYAYEPVSLRLLYEFCRTLIEPDARIITTISSTGGGRDVGRRGPNGATAAELCDYVIVTDEDPYEDDPKEIIDQVAEGAIEAGAVEGENMWRILDRTEGIHKAISLAKPGDVVLLTAKGAEQKMCVAGDRKIDWDDRRVAREALQKS
jgi:UDP-N-acetylmuramoyl-L-alanyl-D-glutamate--2,6-diaminopimelate ligase